MRINCLCQRLDIEGIFTFYVECNVNSKSQFSLNYIFFKHIYINRNSGDVGH